jgi:non-ribosomal peptide synthetase component E (peptide arylation enzyme)
MTSMVGVEQPLDGVVYLPANDLERYVAAGIYPTAALGHLLAQAADRYGERIALSGPEGELSFKELDALSDRLAAALLEVVKLRPLDRAIFQLNNCQLLVVSVVACWKSGVIPVCTIAAHREHEITQLVQLSDARAHFVQGDAANFDLLAFARAQVTRTPMLQHRVVVLQRSAPRSGQTRQTIALQANEYELENLIGAVTLDDARAMLASLRVDPFQVAAFQLSGGTTGTPKIIPRMHNEYAYQMQRVAATLGWGESDCIFMPLPMMHNANMGCGWGPALLAGARVVITPNVTPETFVQVMQVHRPTWVVAAKPILMRLKDSPVRQALDFSTLRGVISTDAAPLVREVLGVPGYHIFGMTEGTIMYTRFGDSAEVLDSTVGRPISDLDEVRLLVPGTEQLVERGTVGELAVRGPYTIRGYFRAPDRNQEAFTAEGFYRSGDLMKEHRIDGMSFYSFEGRIKDVIDRGGEKINCEEIERAVQAHPAVSDVAVVAMPDPEYGQRGCAFVVLKAGHAALSVADLGEYLRAFGMAKFKWPERVECIAALPLTKVGKLDKEILRERIAAQLQRERQAEEERT